VRTTYQGDKKDEGDQIAKSYYQLALKAKNIIRDLDPIVIHPYTYIFDIITIINKEWSHFSQSQKQTQWSYDCSW